MMADYDAAIRNHQVWVFFDSATLLAVLELIVEPDAFILENIAVANGLQGRGVGGRLPRSKHSGRATTKFSSIQIR